MTERVGILGGTFDPIHIGHLAAAEDAAWRLGMSRVLLIPNARPPHKGDRAVSATEHRVAMATLAIADNPLFVLDRIELNRAGPSYTLDTLRQLRARYGANTTLSFLVGCDALGQLHTWHEPDAILEEFGLVVMERPTGSPVDWPVVERRFPHIRRQVEMIDVAELEISGSDIRSRVREGRPIRYYVPPPVARYIEEHRLYRDAPV